MSVKIQIVTILTVSISNGDIKRVNTAGHGASGASGMAVSTVTEPEKSKNGKKRH